MKCIKIMYRTVDGTIKAFFLDQTVSLAVIGRDPDCEIRIQSKAFAPHHAIMVWEDGRVFVMFPPRLRIKNGLNVDGERLTRKRIEVMMGSELSIGTVVFAKTCLPGDVVDLPDTDLMRELRPMEEANDGYDDLPTIPAETSEHPLDIGQLKKAISGVESMKFTYTAIGGEKKVIVLDQATPKAVIGRNADCEMRTDCKEVSRYHAVLTWEDGRVYVQFPRGSKPRNGLDVDGESLLGDEQFQVFAGTRLTVGNFLAVASDDTQEQASAGCVPTGKNVPCSQMPFMNPQVQMGYGPSMMYHGQGHVNTGEVALQSQPVQSMQPVQSGPLAQPMPPVQSMPAVQPQPVQQQRWSVQQGWQGTSKYSFQQVGQIPQDWPTQQLLLCEWPDWQWPADSDAKKDKKG